MTQEEAIELAKSWVQKRFPAVPPIVDASEIGSASLPVYVLSEDERQSLLPYKGTWIVTFFCSWDTDALGMPPTLIVSVNPHNGSVRLEN